MNKKLFTYALAVVIAISAFQLVKFMPLLGRNLIAIVIGMTLRATPVRNYLDGQGLAFLRTGVLRTGIILLGFDLSLRILLEGVSTLPYIFIYMIFSFGFAMLFGRMMGVNDKTSFLIGSGSAICGGSAILTLGPLIDIDDEDFTFAISTVSVSNLVALVVPPIIGKALDMSQRSFGLFAGVSIKDVASVVAVTSDYGTEAAGFGTTVKLTRVLMLVAVVLGVVLVNSRKQQQSMQSADGKAMSTGEQMKIVISSIPGFVIAFIAVILLVSFVSVPEVVTVNAKLLSGWLLTIALAGIGLNTDFRSILANGLKPILLGEISWYAATAAILAVIMMFYKG